MVPAFIQDKARSRNNLRPLVEQEMNHCVTNYYRNGKDLIDHHSDKILNLERDGVIIVSVSAMNASWSWKEVWLRKILHKEFYRMVVCSSWVHIPTNFSPIRFWERRGAPNLGSVWRSVASSLFWMQILVEYLNVIFVRDPEMHPRRWCFVSSWCRSCSCSICIISCFE